MTAATSALISTGTTFKVKIAGASAFVAIGGVTDFSGLGGGSATVVDVTDLSSPRKEKLIGLADEGQIKLTLNYIPGDAGQIALEDARDDSSKAAFEITLPDGTKFTHDGFVLMFDKGVGVDKQVTASVNIEITGIVAKTVVA